MYKCVSCGRWQNNLLSADTESKLCSGCLDDFYN